MVKALFMDDSYLKEWDTTVISVMDDIYITLEETAFYPRGGGVENDTGIMKTDEKEYLVIFTGKFSGAISHEVDVKGLKRDDKVHCLLDWNRRYKLMRYHTAAHVLSGLFYKNHNLLMTGNQLTTEKGRIDLNMNNMDVDLFKKVIADSNYLINKDLDVDIYYLKRQEALEDPDLFKLAKGFSKDIPLIRIVDIKGFDRQADGGCHVKSLGEIGHITFKNAVSKGKNFKRVYFTIDDK